MVTTSLLQGAQSPDQSLVAVVPPIVNSGRVLVQVYRVSGSTPSCQLQLTLTHLSSEKLHELIFCGNSSIVARFGTSQIIQWDLDRGVVAQTLEAKDDDEDEEFVGLATSLALQDAFYVLVKHSSNKLVVQEYSRTSGKLQRKIKSGRWEGGGVGVGDSQEMTTLCVSASTVIVQTAPGVLRVMNNQTGKKNGKIKAGKGAIGIHHMKAGKDETLVTSHSSGAIVLYNLATCEEIVRMSHITPQTSNITDGALQMVDDKMLVENVLFSKEGSTYEKMTMMHSLHPLAAFLTAAGNVLALVYQKRTGCQSLFVALDDDDVAATMDLDKRAAEAEAKAGENSDKGPPKRKASEPMILGPGQAGVEVAPPTKKPKSDKDDENDNDDNEDQSSAKDVTIAERLQQLTKALDEDSDDDDDDDEDDGGGGDNDEDMDGGEDRAKTPAKPKFKPQKATTESLKELLTQALQSSDDSMLELALGVRDVKVISTTLKEIDSSRIVTLLSKLTTRLATNPLRAEGLALWLSHCLRQGKFQPHHLAPLRNLLYERTESFSDLLRLEGRLGLMCDVE